MKKSFNQKGSSLVSGMVAAAIVLVMAAGVTRYVVSQKQFNAQISGASSCRGDVESLLKDFSDNSNSRVANSLTGTATDNVANRTLASIGNPLAPYGSSVVNTSGGLNQYSNFQNIENAVTRTFKILRAQPTLCTTANGITIDSTNVAAFRNIFTNSSILDRVISTNKTVVVRIAPVSLSTGAENCTANVAPLSNANMNNDIGFKVKISVNTPVTGHTCNGEMILTYNSDTSAPNISVINPVTSNPGTCVFSGVVESSEPGSIFECSLNGGATWSPCNGITLANTHLGPNVNTRVNLSVPGVAGALNSFRMRAVDTSGNRSPAGSYVSSPNVSCVPPVSCPAGFEPITDPTLLNHPSANAYVGKCRRIGDACNGTNTAQIVINQPTNLGSGYITTLSCCPAGTSPSGPGTFAGYCTTACSGPPVDVITAYYPYSSTRLTDVVYGTDGTSCAAACTMICANYVNCFYRANCKGGPEGDGAWMSSCGNGGSMSLGCGAFATMAVCSDGNPNHECNWIGVELGNDPAAAFPTDTRPNCCSGCTPSVAQSSVTCGAPVPGVDSCGNACTTGQTGTGLNNAQCADPATVACGATINDTCGNSCGTVGTSSCCTPTVCNIMGDPSDYSCNTPIPGTNNCGGACTRYGTSGCGGGGGGPLVDQLDNG